MGRRRRAGRAAADSYRRSPPTATPRRTATCRTPRRRACACAGRWPARRDRGRASSPAHREQVKRAIELAPAYLSQGEVGRRDRRREALIEALGEAEARVQRVPSEAQRVLVQAQLAGVEEPVHVHAGKAAAAQALELLRAVLVHV